MGEDAKMTTMAQGIPAPGGRDDGFFRTGAFVMAAVIVAGFSVQLAMGRSSFSSPPLVHAHAVVFMGWVVIYLLQNILATTGRVALHRKLGWLAAVWVFPMLVLGCAVTVAIVRRAGVPFFFRPLQFLIFDPATLLTFAGLTVAAIILRRRRKARPAHGQLNREPGHDDRRHDEGAGPEETVVPPAGRRKTLSHSGHVRILP
jgi:hypothetical protein